MAEDAYDREQKSAFDHWVQVQQQTKDPNTIGAAKTRLDKAILASQNKPKPEAAGGTPAPAATSGPRLGAGIAGLFGITSGKP